LPVVRLTQARLLLCAVVLAVPLATLAVAVILVVSILGTSGLAAVSLFSPRVRNTERAPIRVTRRQP
jgi:hypothetical protein